MSCSNNSDMIGNVNTLEEQTQETNSNVQKIEIIHFHGTNQCYSCKTVGAYAEETIKTYFADDSRIEFRSINVDEFENKELTIKYGATGSSLFIGVYDEDGFHAEQNAQVWYKIYDKDDYLNYLKSIIENKLD